MRDASLRLAADALMAHVIQTKVAVGPLSENAQSLLKRLQAVAALVSCVKSSR